MQIEFLLLHSSNQNRTLFQCICKSIFSEKSDFNLILMQMGYLFKIMPQKSI